MCIYFVCVNVSFTFFILFLSCVELTNLITLKQSKTTLLGELKDHYSTISKNADVIKILKEDIESLTNKRNILT